MSRGKRQRLMEDWIWAVSVTEWLSGRGAWVLYAFAGSAFALLALTVYAVTT